MKVIPNPAPSRKSSTFPLSAAGWLALVMLLVPERVFACSCFWAGPLLTVGPRAELIVRAKVLNYHGRSEEIDLAMDVEVLEVLKGDTGTARIRIWGDNGMQCRPYVSRFPVQTEWIFAIDKLTSKEGRPGDYVISVCGEYWARVEKDNVTGRLSSPIRQGIKNTPEKLSLEEFRKKLAAARR